MKRQQSDTQHTRHAVWYGIPTAGVLVAFVVFGIQCVCYGESGHTRIARAYAVNRAERPTIAATRQPLTAEPLFQTHVAMTSEPTATASATSTAVPTASATNTAVPTASATSTAVPTASATSTAVPTATLLPVTPSVQPVQPMMPPTQPERPAPLHQLPDAGDTRPYHIATLFFVGGLLCLSGWVLLSVTRDQ